MAIISASSISLFRKRLKKYIDIFYYNCVMLTYFLLIDNLFKQIHSRKYNQKYKV